MRCAPAAVRLRRVGVRWVTLEASAFAAAAAASLPVAATGLLQRNFAASPKDRPLPPGGSVVVVGGGISGVATARELARGGYRVTLIEEQPSPAEGASRGNAGTLGVHMPARRLSTPAFFFSAPKWLARRPVAEGDLAVNKFCHPAVFRDPSFWWWGATFMRLLATHTADDIPFMAQWRERVREERRALEVVAGEEGIAAFEVT
eukprot:Hpha_TRINITY_DN19103_c0_g1::TRINITY_DN19103_c0_g1_i1::g.94788::m.94788